MLKNVEYNPTKQYFQKLVQSMYLEISKMAENGHYWPFLITSSDTVRFG